MAFELFYYRPRKFHSSCKLANKKHAITMTVEQAIKDKLEIVPNFPKEGIFFRDITPILESPECYTLVYQALAEKVEAFEGRIIVGIESRGFVFASAVGSLTSLPLVLARKPGKLPRETFSVDYELEYGTESLELHCDSPICKSDRIVVIDDLVATGGTAVAAASLVTENFGVPRSNLLVLSVINIDECEGDETILAAGFAHQTLLHSKL